MSETNKDVVRQLNKGFEAGDEAMILACLADDVRWDVPPHFTAEGKEAFRQRITSAEADGPPVITLHHLVAEDDWVTVEGYVENKFKAGGVFKARFHNAYRLRDGKVVTMTSYVVPVG